MLEPLKEFYNRTPGLIFGGCVVAGIFLMFAGAFAEPGASALSGNWALNLIGKIGQLAVISGVIGAVTRYIVMTNVIKDELAELLLNNDKVLERRKYELPELWRKLTQLIYLPWMREVSAEELVFSEKVHKSIESSFNYEVPYYVCDLKKIFRVGWEDEKNKILAVEESSSFTVVPFEGATKVNYETYFIPAEDSAFEDYALSRESFKVDGVEEKIIPIDGKKGSGYNPLSGKNSYRIDSVEKYQLNLRKDPLIFVRCPYVVDGVQIFVKDADNNTKGMSSVFVDSTAKEIFEVPVIGDQRDSPRIEQVFDCKGVILPGQGFLLVFVT